MLLLICKGLLCTSLLLNVFVFIWCSCFRTVRTRFSLLINDLFRIIDTILWVIFYTLSFEDFWATFTRLIKVKLLRFGIFCVSRFFISFTILLLWRLIVLILRTFNRVTTWLNFAWWFPSHRSRCFISVSGCRALDCFITLRSVLW